MIFGVLVFWCKNTVLAVSTCQDFHTDFVQPKSYLTFSKFIDLLALFPPRPSLSDVISSKLSVIDNTHQFVIRFTWNGSKWLRVKQLLVIIIWVFVCLHIWTTSSHLCLLLPSLLTRLPFNGCQWPLRIKLTMIYFGVSESTLQLAIIGNQPQVIICLLGMARNG